MELLKLTKPFVDVRGLLARIVMGIPGCLGRTIIGPESKIVSLHTCHIRKDNMLLPLGRKDQPMAPQGHKKAPKVASPICIQEALKQRSPTRTGGASRTGPWERFFTNSHTNCVSHRTPDAEGIATQRLSKMYRTTFKVLRRPMRNRDCGFAPGHGHCAHPTH